MQHSLVELCTQAAFTIKDVARFIKVRGLRIPPCATPMFTITRKLSAFIYQQMQ